jgi:cytochrome c oxidase cbb3-type subunit 3
VLRWSQGGKLAESLERYEERYGPERTRIAQASLAELQGDDAAMRSAWHVFNASCSACHGRDAAGQASLFPNLGDGDWQWGGEEAQLTQTIAMGRQAVMPPWQAVLNDDGVAKMADYVVGLSKGAATGAGGAAPDPAVATQYATYCSACHGPDGGGLALLGAPALNDDVWLYGGSAGAVRDSIAIGRTGVMPAFAQRLDATQIKLLAAWLASGAKPPPEN